MSIPRPTRAECEALLGVHALYWCSQCGQAWSLPERESHLVLCRPSSPEHYRHILKIDAAALAHAKLALLDENEALAKAATKYHDSQECAWCYDDGQCDLADALAEYAKRKQEGK